MLKYCLKKWDENKDFLRERLAKDAGLNQCGYEYLVALIVDEIFNRGEDYVTWDDTKITEIDNGDYQGTLLYLIPRNTYQPCEYEYLMTYVDYGSCSGCDTLLGIQGWDDEAPTEEQLKDYMTLCKDIVTNTIKPYNGGWRHDDEFTEVTV